jgi:AcrR family transcriptional regulator
MSSPPTPNPARPGPKPRLTRDQVLQTALDLIDDDGPAAFSMRRVADELGVGVMTLYGYVRNREEMIEGITGLAFAELGQESEPEPHWERRLHADTTALYSLCRRHPHIVPLVLDQTTASPGLFRIRERMLGTLQAAGFDQPTALMALGVLTSYALGFGRSQAPPPIDLPERIRELPAAEFPHLSAAADHYATHLSTAAFEFGLDLSCSRG